MKSSLTVILRGILAILLCVILPSCLAVDNLRAPEGLTIVDREVKTKVCEFGSCKSTEVVRYEMRHEFLLRSGLDFYEISSPSEERFREYIKQEFNEEWQYIPTIDELEADVVKALKAIRFIGNYPELAGHEYVFLLALAVFKAEIYTENIETVSDKEVKLISAASTIAVILGEIFFYRRELYSVAKDYFNKALLFSEYSNYINSYISASLYLRFINNELVGDSVSRDTFFDNVPTLEVVNGLNERNSKDNLDSWGEAKCFVDRMSSKNKSTCDALVSKLRPIQKLVYKHRHDSAKYIDYLGVLKCLDIGSCNLRNSSARTFPIVSETMSILLAYDGWSVEEKYRLLLYYLRFMLEEHTAGDGVKFYSEVKRLGVLVNPLCEEFLLYGCKGFFAKYAYSQIPLAPSALFFKDSDGYGSGFMESLFNAFIDEGDFVSSKSILKKVGLPASGDSVYRSFDIGDVPVIPFTDRERLLLNVMNDVRVRVRKNIVENSNPHQKLDDLKKVREKLIKDGVMELVEILITKPKNNEKRVSKASADGRYQKVRLHFIGDMLALSLSYAGNTKTNVSNISKSVYLEYASAYQLLLESGELDLANQISNIFVRTFAEILPNSSAEVCDDSELNASLIPYEAWFSEGDYAYNTFEMTECSSLQLTADAAMTYVGIDYESNEGFPALPGIQEEENSLQEIFGSKNRSFKDLNKVDAFRKLDKSLVNEIVHISAHFTQGRNNELGAGFVAHDAVSVFSLQQLTDVISNQGVKILSLIGCGSAIAPGLIDDRIYNLFSKEVDAIHFTLWNISDLQASKYFEILYKGLLIEKKSTAEAIRHAKRYFSTSRRAHLRSPLYWAGYRYGAF